MENLINIGIILTYLMIGFACVSAVGFGIKNMMQKTGSAKKTLFTIGGLIAIIIIAYITASDEILNEYKKYNITTSVSKQVGMGLITFYILIFGAIAAILYSELSKMFSK